MSDCHGKTKLLAPKIFSHHPPHPLGLKFIVNVTNDTKRWIFSQICALKIVVDRSVAHVHTKVVIFTYMKMPKRKIRLFSSFLCLVKTISPLFDFAGSARPLIVALWNFLTHFRFFKANPFRSSAFHVGSKKRQILISWILIGLSQWAWLLTRRRKEKTDCVSVSVKACNNFTAIWALVTQSLFGFLEHFEQIRVFLVRH